MNILVEADFLLSQSHMISTRRIAGVGVQCAYHSEVVHFVSVTSCHWIRVWVWHCPWAFFLVTFGPAGQYLETRPMRVCPSWLPEGGGYDRPPVTCLVVAIPEHGGI